MPRDEFGGASSILVMRPGKSGVATFMPPMPPMPPAPPARSPSQMRASRREITSLVVVAMVLAAAIVTARSGRFTAASNVGYWLGVAGGTAMLLLFLYPLSKRWRALCDIGPPRLWFALHMLLGIAGPVLIIVHSTLRFGSINATFAFVAMVLVAGSGIGGRFLYARIHHGLYGRRASLAELRAQAGLDSQAARSKLAFAPEVERKLNEFARRAEQTRHTGLVHPLRFFALGWHATVARRRCTAEATRVLTQRARKEHWRADTLERRISRRRTLIAAHLRAVQRVAQFGAFERLFSIWHVLHAPLVYLLVLSAIAHVIAVHMY